MCTFLLTAIWGSLETLQRAKESLKSNQTRTMSQDEVLAAWEHLWPKLMLEIPVTLRLTALGLLSHSSLTDQGRLAEPFGFVMGLAVQCCLLF